MESLKSRLRAGEQLIGTMITTLPSPDLVKILKNRGFDFCMIDCEHGSFTTREVSDMIGAGRGFGMPVMVRIPEVRREHVLHYMEMGAAGLLLPNTESADQARQLVDYAKYAPLGHRGVSLSRPHTDFLKVNGPEYMAKSNGETLLICQIESQAGVDHVGEILSVPGIDAALIGPNDMSQDFGILGQYTHPRMEEAFRQVMDAAEKLDKWSGVHFGGAEPLKPWLRKGMQLNMWCTDIGLLSLGAQLLPDLRAEAGSHAVRQD